MRSPAAANGRANRNQKSSNVDIKEAAAALQVVYLAARFRLSRSVAVTVADLAFGERQ